MSLPRGANGWSVTMSFPGLKVIKLDYSLKLKIKRNDLKVYKLEAWSDLLAVWAILDTAAQTISMGKRDLIALLCLSSWCLTIAVWLFLTTPRVCLQFVIVVFPDHTHFLKPN